MLSSFYVSSNILLFLVYAFYLALFLTSLGLIEFICTLFYHLSSLKLFLFF